MSVRNEERILVIPWTLAIAALTLLAVALLWRWTLYPAVDPLPGDPPNAEIKIGGNPLLGEGVGAAMSEDGGLGTMPMWLEDFANPALSPSLRLADVVAGTAVLADDQQAAVVRTVLSAADSPLMVRNEAANLLMRYGDPQLVPILAAMAADGSQANEVAVYAVQHLGQALGHGLGVDQAHAALWEIVRGDDRDAVLREAYQALIWNADAQAIEGAREFRRRTGLRIHGLGDDNE